MKIGAIILCGGKSSRMGKDKGLMPFYSSPMIMHIINPLRSNNIPINIITNNEEYQQFGLRITPDIYKDKGPLGGIHAGLAASKFDANFIISCDTPLLPTALFSFLQSVYNDEDALVVENHKRIHPLIGIYHKRIIPVIESMIKEDHLSLSQLHERIKTRNLDLTEHAIFGNQYFYTNMNRLEEVKEMEDIVEVRFFGMIAEQMTMSSTNISLRVVQESKLLRPLLEAYFPPLENTSYVIAVDQTIKEEISENELIKEISVLPPFAGG